MLHNIGQYWHVRTCALPRVISLVLPHVLVLETWGYLWYELINALWIWTPKLEINTNTKITKGPRTTRRTYVRTDGQKDRQKDRQTYYTATQGIWTRGLHPRALPAITGHMIWSPKVTWIIRYRDGHISLNGPHWGVNTNTKISKRPADD